MDQNTQSLGIFGRKRNYRIIGTLIIIIGVILLIVGYNMVVLGEKAKSRYETLGGTVFRILSPEDQKNYEDAKDTIAYGNILEAVGAIITIIGVVILIRPEFYFYLQQNKR